MLPWINLFLASVSLGLAVGMIQKHKNRQRADRQRSQRLDRIFKEPKDG